MSGLLLENLQGGLIFVWDIVDLVFGGNLNFMVPLGFLLLT